MEKKYKANLSIVAILITIVVNALLTLIALYSISTTDTASTAINLPGYPYNIIFGIGIVVLLFTVYLLRPRAYSINKGKAVIIEKLVKPIAIPIDDILEIRKVDYKRLTLVLRVFGSYGIWGYFGVYHSQYYGYVNVQASNLKDTVFIATRKKRIYIMSPEDPEKFVADVLALKYPPSTGN